MKIEDLGDAETGEEEGKESLAYEHLLLFGLLEFCPSSSVKAGTLCSSFLLYFLTPLSTKKGRWRIVISFPSFPLGFSQRRHSKMLPGLGQTCPFVPE